MPYIKLNDVTGKITNIKLELTANEALERIVGLRGSAFIGETGSLEEKREYLYAIALEALTGFSEKFVKSEKKEDEGESMIFNDIDIPYLTENQIDSRYKWLDLKMNSVRRVEGFIDIARYALTGVPF